MVLYERPLNATSAGNYHTGMTHVYITDDDLASRKTREKERETDRRRESSTGYKQFIHQWFIPKGMLARSIQHASRKQEDTSARCLLSAELLWVKCFCSPLTVSSRLVSRVLLLCRNCCREILSEYRRSLEIS